MLFPRRKYGHAGERQRLEQRYWSRRHTAAASGKQSYFNRVGPGYFQTMGTRLIAGREFNERDTLSSPKVAIVNEVFAQKFFGGANPVGRTFHLEAEAGKPEPLIQIVGMVKNTKYYELREDSCRSDFFPIAQDDDPGAGATLYCEWRVHRQFDEGDQEPRWRG